MGTEAGEKKILKKFKEIKENYDIDIELRICDPLLNNYAAFEENNNIWEDLNELEEAKALCVQIGAQVHKRNPLGYGKKAMLVVFPNTCPNNSLPILHAGQNKKEGWQPLFPRPKN